MSQDAMSRQVAEYSGLVAHLADGLACSGRAKLVGAEYDDLNQEGLIAVWQTLLRGLPVSKDVVENRMKDWIRYQGRTSGTDYGSVLPLETAEEFVA